MVSGVDKVYVTANAVDKIKQVVVKFVISVENTTVWEKIEKIE